MKNENVLLIVLGIVLLLFLVGGFGMMGFGTYEYGYRGMMGMMYGYGNGMMFFGWLYGILIIVALILFIVWLIKQIQKPNRR